MALQIKKVDEVFAFDRTVSRLLEMQSRPYLEELAERELSALFASYDSDRNGFLDQSELEAMLQDFQVSNE